MKIIITGMHRSGTSMIAGLMQLCGLHLGTNLLGKASSNARGHFEDRGFLQLNQEILKANGGSWDKPPPFVIVTDHTVQRLRGFLTGWPRTKIVGWKDPRACLTLPLWAAAIHPEELRVLVALRPREEIIDSLRKRNRFGVEKARSLTDIYMRRVKKYLDNADLKWMATGYRAYLGKSWRAELSAAAKFCGLEVPTDTSAIEDFIDPDLCHHRSNQ